MISFSPPTEGIRTTTCPLVSRAMLFGVLRSKYGSTMMILTPSRSEEHTSELQSRSDLVCRLLLEKKKIYVPHRHVYGAQGIMFMKDGVNDTPLPTVTPTGYHDYAAFLGTIIPATNTLPNQLIQG